MKIEIFRDREVDAERDGQAGNIEENIAEILEFTFPEQIVGNDINLLNKYIEFELDGKVKPFEIVDDKFAITCEIAQYDTVKAQVSIMKSGLLLFKSNTFYLRFGESLESTIVISATDLEIINTLKEQLQSLQSDYEANLITQDEYLNRLQSLETLSIQMQNTLNEIISDESTRIANENERKSNELARITTEESRTTAEQSRITAENNRVVAENTRTTVENSRVLAENARETAEQIRQTNEQNRSASEINRQNTFNQQMNAVDTAIENIQDMTESYNQNAIEKTAEFNNNVQNKTDSFNSNAETKVNEYNTNAQNKINEYDEHAGEFITRLNDVETLIGDINTVLDYTNGEVI